MRSFLSLGSKLSAKSTLWHQLAQSGTLILVGVSAWWLGQLVWQVVAPAPSVSRWQAPQIDKPKSVTPSFDLAAITQMSLFGQYQPTVEKPVITPPKTMPKTRLNVSLVGVVASSNPKYSLAVLSRGQSQDTYGIGETLSGTSAKIKDILADHVILLNGDQDEVVWLDGVTPKKAASNRSSSTKKGSTTASRNKSETANDIENIKEEILEDPKALFKYIRLSPVHEDDKLVGYRVTPGRDPVLFNDVGLKPNDLVVQLNGQDLTDPSVMAVLWKELSSASALALTVDRDGQLHQVEINL